MLTMALELPLRGYLLFSLAVHLVFLVFMAYFDILLILLVVVGSVAERCRAGSLRGVGYNEHIYDNRGIFYLCF